MYDSIIIGGGAAGITAAIYLARKKMKIILLTEDYGGQMAKAGSIENYPGFKSISGIDLTTKLQEHLAEYDIENKTESVKEIVKTDAGFEVKTASDNYQTKTILVCSGKTHRHLGVPGEEEFAGKGVSYCATCDGPLFQGKTVAVVGGGNSALDAALDIEKYATKVYLLNIGPEVQGDAILKEKFEKTTKGELINNAKTLEILGDQMVKSLKYEDNQTKEQKEIACDGVFVEVGWTPSTKLLKGLVKLNEMEEIEVDKAGATSISGIFAAGDVTSSLFKQIIIAAGDGATVALSAWKYLLTQKLN
ncbi:MAG: FAD-dependent oxidoreductase [Patescibacteria group bacterium]